MSKPFEYVTMSEDAVVPATVVAGTPLYATPTPVLQAMITPDPANVGGEVKMSFNGTPVLTFPFFLPLLHPNLCYNLAQIKVTMGNTTDRILVQAVTS